jgi:glycosyltransferase involved in cell wall biosynthesis
MTSVSVLIPVYNGQAFIETAVRSALEQRGVSTEVIVIDDGSTDETPAILRAFGPAIRVLRQPNAGHVRARNNGAHLARGDWFAFLDADDEWLPGKLAQQLEAAAAISAGMAYTNYEAVGSLSRFAGLGSDAVTMWDGDIFEPLLFGNFVTVSSVIMHRGWFERLGGFDTALAVCEDWDMWLRYSAAGGITALHREPLIKYRWHANGMSQSHERMLLGRVTVIERALASERGRRVSSRTSRRARAGVWKASAWFAMADQRANALAWYLRSWRYWPWDGAVYKGVVKCMIGRA